MARSKVLQKPIDLGPTSRIIVVDDTAVNVKVLTKMLARSTSAPVLSCTDGQSAIDIVRSSSHEDHLLILMDWHMPGMCGLAASEAINDLVRNKGSPRCHVCMLTADIEGLRLEMARRRLDPDEEVTKGS